MKQPLEDLNNEFLKDYFGKFSEKIWYSAILEKKKNTGGFSEKICGRFLERTSVGVSERIHEEIYKKIHERFFCIICLELRFIFREISKKIHGGILEFS